MSKTTDKSCNTMADDGTTGSVSQIWVDFGDLVRDVAMPLANVKQTAIPTFRSKLGSTVSNDSCRFPDGNRSRSVEILHVPVE